MQQIFYTWMNEIVLDVRAPWCGDAVSYELIQWIKCIIKDNKKKRREVAKPFLSRWIQLEHRREFVNCDLDICWFVVDGILCFVLFVFIWRVATESETKDYLLRECPKFFGYRIADC